MERISITLEQEDLDDLDKIAKKMDRNRSDTIRQLIKEYFKK